MVQRNEGESVVKRFIKPIFLVKSLIISVKFINIVPSTKSRIENYSRLRNILHYFVVIFYN